MPVAAKAAVTHGGLRVLAMSPYFRSQIVGSSRVSLGGMSPHVTSRKPNVSMFKPLPLKGLEIGMSPLSP